MRMRSLPLLLLLGLAQDDEPLRADLVPPECPLEVRQAAQWAIGRWGARPRGSVP